MKTRNVSSSRRIWISCCGMLLLTALVFCVLPRIVPYERINVFYGLGEGADRRAVDFLPANQGSCEVYLLMDNLMNIPQTSLLANGKKVLTITKEQTDAAQPVILPASLLETPGDLRLTVAFEYTPLIRLCTNTVTVPVRSVQEE